MTDLDTLHRAFAELERRADAHLGADLTVRPASRPARPARRRPVLVGAIAAAMVAAVAGTVVLTTDHTRSTTAPAASAALSASPSAPTASSPVSTAPPTSGSPTTAERFTAALAGLATFTVTGGSGAGTSGPPSASATVSADGATPTAPSTVPAPSSVAADATYLVGVLTSSAGSGGFDVQPTSGAATASCSEGFACTLSTLADGSTLAVGTSPVLDPDGSTRTGVTYEVVLARRDGTGVLFHLSNERDPKGMGEQLSPRPPLTTAQMTAVVTSPAWTR